MITYRDQAWCSQKCDNRSCFRNYTDEEHQKNINGVDLPLSQADFKSDECGFVQPDQQSKE